MCNPWLSIPLADYEGHMALPAVAQAQMLAAELKIAVSRQVPASCAIIGCAGGNGFDKLANAGVARIVGIDLNPLYVTAARARHASLAGLELHVANIEQPLRDCAPVELLYAALVFEYVDVTAALATLRALCVRGGTLVVVLQSPAATQTAVTPTVYASLQTLAGTMSLRDPAAFTALAASAGFVPSHQSSRTLPSGKRFEVLTFLG
jgi:trans-aconitate methyltransferase